MGNGQGKLPSGRGGSIQPEKCQNEMQNLVAILQLL
jgi:hypothetical protein